MNKSTAKGFALAAGLAAMGAPAVAETELKLGSVAPSGSPWGWNAPSELVQRYDQETED